jgi:hypothetical protein
MAPGISYSCRDAQNVRIRYRRMCRQVPAPNDYYLLQLKSRLGGWLKQFVCDTVLTYSMYAALRFSINHFIQRTMTTFELEYQAKNR